MLRMIMIGVALLAFSMSTPAAHADTVADFYRGKTIHMVIGYGAGGGYDLYGRIAAEFLGKHIPGNPIIDPAEHAGRRQLQGRPISLFAAAPKDGTYLGSVSQTLALDTATIGQAEPRCHEAALSSAA